MIEICQGFEYGRDRQGSEHAWVGSWIILKCLNIPETEPKITV